jgi:hypothetical protein
LLIVSCTHSNKIILEAVKQQLINAINYIIVADGEFKFVEFFSRKTTTGFSSGPEGLYYVIDTFLIAQQQGEAL